MNDDLLSAAAAGAGTKTVAGNAAAVSLGGQRAGFEPCRPGDLEGL
jgi:hypothetical protein